MNYLLEHGIEGKIKAVGRIKTSLPYHALYGELIFK
jgi:hypothetical protein